MARAQDSTRLYAWGSNVFYGTKGCDPESDFYTSTQYFTHMIRGTSALGENDPGRLPGFINNKYPAPGENYDASMAQLRQTYQKPVFSFEVGQFEILPDFDELQDFQGVSDPANYRIIQEKVRQQGLEPVWKRYVEATGELSRIGYRAEVEAAMNTDEMSGISLLQLQDFPGQGTALVGMMDSHLKPKPFAFAQPEAFQAFFRDRLVLASLPRYTYQAGESFTGEFFLANYGKTELSAPLEYTLTGPGVSLAGSLPARPCPAGKRTPLGAVTFQLPVLEQAQRLELRLAVGEVENTYPCLLYTSRCV